jgi:hypothetical protein
MAKLTAAARKNVPKSRMGVPSQGKPKSKGGAVSGSYPMPDRAHAANAKARASGKPVAAQVNAKANRLYPGLGKSKSKTTKGR